MAGMDDPAPITRHSFWFVLLKFVDPAHHNRWWLQTGHQIVWIIAGPFPVMALLYMPAMPEVGQKIRTKILKTPVRSFIAIEKRS